MMKLIVTPIVLVTRQVQADTLAFGNGSIWKGELSSSAAWPTLASYEGKVTWACDLSASAAEASAALCDEDASMLRWWYGGSNFKNVDLAPLTAPVGAHTDGEKVYVACYGASSGTSGVAVLDMDAGQVSHSYMFGEDGHIHNVYAFQVGGQTEIIPVSIGNPWPSAGDPVPGWGLMRLDTTAGKFDTSYTMDGSDPGRLSIRSAAQQSDGSVFAITQEPAGQPTKLARLEFHDGKFQIKKVFVLPSRQDGDGGGDVFLGRDMNTFFATDRGAAPNAQGGMVYYFQYESGEFKQSAAYQSGSSPHDPRYTAMFDNGDVASADQASNSITVFPGLGAKPIDYDSASHTIQEMTSVSFLLPSPTPPLASPPGPFVQHRLRGASANSTLSSEADSNV
jgi:hypothetical protein